MNFINKSIIIKLGKVKWRSVLKNIIVAVSFIFLLNFNQLVCAQDLSVKNNNYRPVWNEFCPIGYCNAESKEIKWYWIYAVKEEQAQENYWAMRRVQFERDIKNCDNYPENERNICYERLRSQQNVTTQQYILDEQKRKANEQMIMNFTRAITPVQVDVNYHKVY